MVKNKRLSDNAVDAIVACLLITIFVLGVVYWLVSMPS